MLAPSLLDTTVDSGAVMFDNPVLCTSNYGRCNDKGSK